MTAPAEPVIFPGQTCVLEEYADRQRPVLGSLCTGAGGLDLAVEAVLGPVRHAWHAELDPDASAVLAAHWPGVANLGDITTVDWAGVEPVDILTAGFPCQDLSLAGKRAGLKRGTRSGLWSYVATAIAALRPRLVVVENVRGILSAPADRDLGPGVEDLATAGAAPLRALGRVLGDLADLGFDAEWTLTRASDAGAPHQRKRIFITAWPADSPRPRLEAGREGLPGAVPAGTALLKTPTAQLAVNGGSQHPGKRRAGGHGPTLADEVEHLLPTPDTGESLTGHGRRGGKAGNGRQSGASLDAIAPALAGRWGQYLPAIRRWEATLARVAPDPTEPSPRGGQRLAASFVEWLMGYPAGWVTGHVSRNAALRILGNAVVPQQGALALAELLSAVPAGTR